MEHGNIHDIPYSGKVWQVESLVNLANHLQFANLKPFKVIVTINIPLDDLSFVKIFLLNA